MKAALFALSAMSLAAASFPAAAEQPRHVRSWLDETAQEIQQRTQAPAEPAGTVAVRFGVSADGRLNGPRVVGSSGSPALDRAVLKAAERARPETPPTELFGRKVTLRITAGAAPLQATAPTAQAR